MGPSQRWYRVSQARAPWGDYGKILLSGMTAHQKRTPEGLLRLERTGPFVPPVSMPGLGDLLVTDAFRIRMEESPLARLGFRPVEKTRIVRLEWEQWDQDDFEPEEYPDSGEPEDYILGRPHDPELAARIGPVWEVVLPGRGQDAEADPMRGTPAALHIYAGQRARDWLEENAGTWLRFEDPPSAGELPPCQEPDRITARCQLRSVAITRSGCLPSVTDQAMSMCRASSGARQARSA